MHISHMHRWWLGRSGEFAYHTTWIMESHSGIRSSREFLSIFPWFWIMHSVAVGLELIILSSWNTLVLDRVEHRHTLPDRIGENVNQVWHRASHRLNLQTVQLVVELRRLFGTWIGLTSQTFLFNSGLCELGFSHHVHSMILDSDRQRDPFLTKCITPWR